MLFEAQSQMSSTRNISYLQIPSPRSLEQMDQQLWAIVAQGCVFVPTIERFAWIVPTSCHTTGICRKPKRGVSSTSYKRSCMMNMAIPLMLSKRGK